MTMKNTSNQTTSVGAPTKEGATLDATQIALCRFGLGARPSDMLHIASDPHGYLLRQLAAPKLALLESPTLPTTDLIFRKQRAADEMVRRMREAQPQSTPTTPMIATANAMVPPNAMASGNSMTASPSPKPTDQKPKASKLFQDQMYEDEVKARLDRWMKTDTPLLERLVQFWMNHFTVSAGKNGFITASIGAFEREAIRPYILSKFETMLLAVEQHPVMLIYLDNQNSVGPNSRAGNNGAKGLNENLAREILELHTLGVDGGYTQADVTSFARILTGWIYTDPNNDDVYGGRFTFAPNRHEPGDVSVIGKTYAESGKDQGENALRDFARHPSTARHIAVKLAKAFVADDPPPSLVAKLEATFLKSEGDLAVVTKTLIDAPESWSTAQDKLRSPDEFIIAAMRAGNIPLDQGPFLNALNVLGTPLWRATGPNGYPVDSSSWLAPENIAMRADLSVQLAHEVQSLVEPESFAATILGKRISAETRQALQRAASREQAFALLFMSPEFQRR